ncbi:DNA helicase [Staphylococcus phage vB_SauH_DELF3]|nr:DNA helicase [Staphylococcus phage vB_SauH_DELF3]
MYLKQQNTNTYVAIDESDGYSQDIILNRNHGPIVPKKRGYEHSSPIKRGVCSGYVDFYERYENKYGGGLLPKMMSLSGPLQSNYNPNSDIIDEKCESLSALEGIDDEIRLLGDNGSKITLRAGQCEAVFNSLVNYNGICKQATNGRKVCPLLIEIL